jgi:hypothetical protein
MRSSPERPRLRKREIVFAVAAGVVAAGGAALMLDSDGGDSPMIIKGGPNELTYQVAPFDEISSTGPQDVVITVGEAASVRSEGSPEALSLLEAVVEDGQLIIRPKGRFGAFDWGRVSSATFYVTVPELKGVALAGSGDIRVDRVDGESFEGSIAGPGELSILAMEVDEADFTIGGSGNLVAAGTAGETRVSIGGSGEVRAGGLRSATASVSIGGSGDVALTVDDSADVSIAGSGDVDISGPGRCSVTQMGSGNVRCGGGGGTDSD